MTAPLTANRSTDFAFPVHVRSTACVIPIIHMQHLAFPHGHYTANPPELCCRGSLAASKVPFGNLRNPCAVDAPGATQVTLWPRLSMNAVVSLL